MKTFKRSVAVYVAYCVETHGDDGASRLSATRLINLTPVIPALLRLIVVLTFGVWILRRGLTTGAGLTRNHLGRLTHRLEITVWVIQIGVRALIFGLTPAPVRIR